MTAQYGRKHTWSRYDNEPARRNHLLQIAVRILRTEAHLLAYRSWFSSDQWMAASTRFAMTSAIIDHE